MDIIFRADDVAYADAIDGEIVQVTFEEEKDNSEYSLIEQKKYLLFSISYEFEPISPSIEWFDGKDHNGGGEIVEYTFTSNSLKVKLQNNINFDIAFSIENKLFNQIEAFFNNVLH